MGAYDNKSTPRSLDKSKWIFNPFGDDEKKDEPKEEETDEVTAKKRALSSIKQGFDNKLGL